MHHAFGRFSRAFAGAAALVAVQPGHAQRAGYEPPMPQDGKVHSDTSEQRFGRFTVVRHIEDYRAAPILEGPWLTKEAMLSWRDSSGRIGFSFLDNGASVTLKTEGASADGKTTCIVPGVMVGYDPGPSTADNWSKIKPVIARYLAGCPAIARSDLDRASAEMKAAGADYVAAANAWKAVAVNLFGSHATRCVAARMVDRRVMPPRYACTRYSKPPTAATAAGPH